MTACPGPRPRRTNQGAGRARVCGAVTRFSALRSGLTRIPDSQVVADTSGFGAQQMKEDLCQFTWSRRS